MPKSHPLFASLMSLAAFGIVAHSARAELLALEVIRREPFAGGTAFADTGPYEKLTGIARFAVDPSHSRNRSIVDLDYAPRNARGLVEFEADVVILTPKDPAKSNGAILYDVHNRGNKRALRYFNDAPGDNLIADAAAAGNGFLMRRGYTVVWSGWNGELLTGKGRLLLRTPVATDNGQPIRGPVRYEMVVDKPADSFPVARREGHGSYAPSAAGETAAVLTWRTREADPRVQIPRDQWLLERVPTGATAEGVPGVLGQVRLKLVGGFRPGYLYELVYEAEGPIVQGVGYASVRDLVSFLKFDSTPRNPLRTEAGKPANTRAHAFGVSQSGRFLRGLLHEGFNTDEAGRKVFDGLIPHVAGGGLGSFNHRFAQPTRLNSQHEEHLYPVDRFPFAYGNDMDPLTKRTDGILRVAVNAGTPPKVMHTQSAAEYWHRSGSLVHTDPLGTRDAVIPDNVRVYAFGGTQHSPAPDPLSRGGADNLHNPADFDPLLRALLDALDAWVRDGTPPPSSVYPRLDAGTLAPPSQDRSGFPAIPGVRYPDVVQRPALAEYGPEFATRGVIAIEPPRVLGHYVTLVPRSGPDGNDLGTLLPPDVAVPLATHTGWNLRHRDVGAEGMLALLAGSYIPFPRTRAERLATGDPRESVAERYGSYGVYRDRFTAACDDLVGRRYLLREDADRLTREREKLRGLFPATKE